MIRTFPGLFQDIFGFFKDSSCHVKGTTCNDQRSLLLIAGGVEGTVSSARYPGQRPGRGPGSQVPISSDDPAVEKAKRGQKPINS